MKFRIRDAGRELTDKLGSLATNSKGPIVHRRRVGASAGKGCGIRIG